MASPGWPRFCPFPSLRGFEPYWLAGDAVAAMTLAAIAIPEQLATSRLVGMPPIAGLAAFAAGSIGFAAFGANRFMSVGADSTIAPVMASALGALAVAASPHYEGMAALIALHVGATLLAAGLLRLGWIADLLSVPVTTGFLAGISVHIIVGQLPTILGLEVPRGPRINEAAAILLRLPETQPAPLLIGLGVLAVIILNERRSARIPGALIGLFASGLAVWQFALRDHGVAVLGALPVALPSPSLELPTLNEIAHLLPVSLAVALICIMQTAAVVQSFPTQTGAVEDVSRDFAAVGVGSLLAVLISAFAVNSSPPHTAVVHESGGRSQLTNVFAVVIVIAIVLLAADAFAYVPQAALSGVLVFVGLRIFRAATMRQIARQGGAEISLVGVSAALVVLLPVQEGVTVSIVLSLLHGVYVIARPEGTELARVPGTTVWWRRMSHEPGELVPGVLVFAPGVPIYFCNARVIRARLLEAIAAKPETCRLVVIEASGVLDIDFTGSRIMQEMIADLRAQNIVVKVARLSAARARHAAERSGLAASLGPSEVFLSVEEAIATQGGRRVEPG
jgi:sulfate permease, SulP family